MGRLCNGKEKPAVWRVMRLMQELFFSCKER